MKWILTVRGQITVLDRGGESVFVIRIFGKKMFFLTRGHSALVHCILVSVQFLIDVMLG